MKRRPTAPAPAPGPAPALRAPGDPVTAPEIASKEFLVASRGFAQDEVRAFLSTVALSFQAVEAERDAQAARAGRAEAERDLLQAELAALRSRHAATVQRLEVAEAVRVDALDRVAAAEQARARADLELATGFDPVRADQLADLVADLSATTERLSRLVGPATARPGARP